MVILILKCSGDSKSLSEKSDIYAMLNQVEVGIVSWFGHSGNISP